jgi:hypothetical protein
MAHSSQQLPRILQTLNVLLHIALQQHLDEAISASCLPLLCAAVQFASFHLQFKFLARNLVDL